MVYFISKSNIENFLRFNKRESQEEKNHLVHYKGQVKSKDLVEFSKSSKNMFDFCKQNISKVSWINIGLAPKSNRNESSKLLDSPLKKKKKVGMSKFGTKNHKKAKKHGKKSKNPKSVNKKFMSKTLNTKDGSFAEFVIKNISKSSGVSNELFSKKLSKSFLAPCDNIKTTVSLPRSASKPNMDKLGRHYMQKKVKKLSEETCKASERVMRPMQVTFFPQSMKQVPDTQ